MPLSNPNTFVDTENDTTFEFGGSDDANHSLFSQDLAADTLFVSGNSADQGGHTFISGNSASEGGEAFISGNSAIETGDGPDVIGGTTPLGGTDFLL